MNSDLVANADSSLPVRYARGWHCLGLTKNFEGNKARSVDIFGTRLVVFRGSNGQMHILDGYCPHMGAGLGGSEIVGDTIACPFHGWRWGGDGRCKEIPYSSRIPLKATVKSWPVMEQCGQLFVYNDPQGNPPPPEVAIPAIPAVVKGEASDWTWETFLMPTNVRELVDNLADVAHFFYVHYTRCVQFKNIFDGHTATQISYQIGRDDVAAGDDLKFASSDFSLEATATYHGPSYLRTDYTTNYKGFPIEMYLVLAHYPVTENSFNLHIGVCSKKFPGQHEKEALEAADQFAEANRAAILQDVEIWRNKKRIDNPILCEGDGPIYQLRRWYEQFYCDVDKIDPDMTRRLEIEMDLSVHNKAWKKSS